MKVVCGVGEQCALLNGGARLNRMTKDKECFFIAKWMDRLRVFLPRRNEAPVRTPL